MSQPHLSLDYEKKNAESLKKNVNEDENKNLIDLLETTKNDLELLVSGRKALYAMLTRDDLRRDDIKKKLSELSQKIVELRIRITAFEREYGLE